MTPLKDELRKHKHWDRLGRGWGHDWTRFHIFASERLTGALLDRLTHHVHILEMNGDSYRLKQSKSRRHSTATSVDEIGDHETGEITAP